jgi:hypothetical protein
VRKFGLLLVSVTGLMAWGGIANADTSAPDTQISQVLWGAGSVADTTGAQSATPAATDPDADKVVCKSMDPPTGSRLGSRRECHTQREWDQRTRDDQAKTQQIQSHGFQQNLPHG